MVLAGRCGKLLENCAPNGGALQAQGFYGGGLVFHRVVFYFPLDGHPGVYLTPGESTRQFPPTRQLRRFYSRAGATAREAPFASYKRGYPLSVLVPRAV